MSRGGNAGTVGKGYFVFYIFHVAQVYGLSMVRVSPAGVVSLLFAIFFIILLTYCKIWVVVIAAHPKGANRPAAKAMAGAAPGGVTG